MRFWHFPFRKITCNLRGLDDETEDDKEELVRAEFIKTLFAEKRRQDRHRMRKNVGACPKSQSRISYIAEEQSPLRDLLYDKSTNFLDNYFTILEKKDSDSKGTENKLFKDYVTNRNEYNSLAEKYHGSVLKEEKEDENPKSSLYIDMFPKHKENEEGSNSLDDDSFDSIKSMQGVVDIEETELSSISCESKLDVVDNADFDSFVSNDQWFFNIGTAEKFKTLCSNSEHFWEKTGELPNL